MASDKRPGGAWPNGARAAVSFTLDNLGEAADLNRKLWPESQPIGKHYTVTEVIPKILALLKKYDVSATYFIESWNIGIYGDFILDNIVAAGHEIGWHAWQHEAWAKLKDRDAEVANFKRSFGEEGIGRWLNTGKVTESYHGFRPPGGIINDDTLSLCREFGLSYISPAGQHAATVQVGVEGDKITVLPFRWATVDAYFYMETFTGLRKLKEEYPLEPQSPQVLVERYIAEIDEAIETGGYVSTLFHPFLTNSEERLEALETVLQYMTRKRDQGDIWLVPCKEVDAYIRSHPDVVGSDPQWDLSSWR
jgi:peptidoglycan/xylan/chitin deacetylase (PgdA/CDA1 family)